MLGNIVTSVGMSSAPFLAKQVLVRLSKSGTYDTVSTAVKVFTAKLPELKALITQFRAVRPQIAEFLTECCKSFQEAESICQQYFKDAKLKMEAEEKRKALEQQQQLLKQQQQQEQLQVGAVPAAVATAGACP